MDDLYALDGGGSATAWQRKHKRRKDREAALKARRALRAEAQADLKKRLKKWRILTKKAKSEGWVPLARRRWRDGAGKVVALGRPRLFKKPAFIDMTGQRFGRLTVLRVCPTGLQGGQRCRTWWVQCDCGSPERRVNGTTLRQGNSQSCGCLVRERLHEAGIRRRQMREQLDAAPMSIRLADLQRRIIDKKRITRRDARLLGLVRNALVEEEVRTGIRRRGKSGRPMLARPSGVTKPPPRKRRAKPVVH